MALVMFLQYHRILCRISTKSIKRDGTEKKKYYVSVQGAGHLSRLSKRHGEGVSLA